MIDLDIRELKHRRRIRRQQRNNKAIFEKDWGEGFFFGGKLHRLISKPFFGEDDAILYFVITVRTGMAFRDVQNLLLINHDESLIDDEDLY